MRMIKVQITQFLRPNSQRRQATCELPASVHPVYLDMMAHGCRFEAEVLTNGLVSVTISKGDEDLDSVLSPNGPQVQVGMLMMLSRRSWLSEKANYPEQPYQEERQTMDKKKIEKIRHVLLTLTTLSHELIEALEKDSEMQKEARVIDQAIDELAEAFEENLAS